MSRNQSMTAEWTLDRTLWSELLRVSSELSWRRVELYVKNSNRIPSDDTGVYLIGTCPPFHALKTLGAYTILYAGQVKSTSRGLRTRFLEHIREPSAKMKVYLNCFYPKVDFWYTLIEDPSRIDELEVLLVETLKPPCNMIAAPGSSALIARLGDTKPIR